MLKLVLALDMLRWQGCPADDTPGQRVGHCLVVQHSAKLLKFALRLGLGAQAGLSCARAENVAETSAIFPHHCSQQPRFYSEAHTDVSEKLQSLGLRKDLSISSMPLVHEVSCILR